MNPKEVNLESGILTLQRNEEDIQRMFMHRSKLAKIVDSEILNSYRRLFFYIRELQKTGELKMHNDYLQGNDLATNIYKRKYYLKDMEGRLIENTPEQVFARMSSFISSVEHGEAKQNKWATKFYEIMYDGKFLPGGRVIAGAGDLYRLKTLANCFVTKIDKDNLESIYKTAYECARTYSYGGGIGVDISVLRPKDSLVHNAADKSTGAVSFMEIYSLTTGLIGQSGRRGALMLTLDVKHPDVLHFIKVKKTSNWVTNQITEQCKISGKFDDAQLDLIENKIRENTQVRFANISIKVSDEFMNAVEEQNKYGKRKILVYKKFSGISPKSVIQEDMIHYSYGMPSKPINDYELFKTFDKIDDLNRFLSEYSVMLQKQDLDEVMKRDVFGDYIVNLEGEDFDLAIKYSGDFLLYFMTKQTGEIKHLLKARDIWNSFVEGNYKTAEPGLIFWTNMIKYSPSNYVNKPILSTNPCGEVPLEDGGACNLGSINLSRFVVNGYSDNPTVDWEGIRDTVEIAIRFMDNVVTWNAILNPLEKQKVAASETRRLGLGIMGIADMLNQLGIGYDSTEGTDMMEKVGRFIANVSYQASANISEEKTQSPVFDYESYSKGKFFREALDDETKDLIKEKGLRNIALLSIAPTGTISNIILGYSNGDKNYIGVSGGIEPIFALYYTRRSESFEGKKFMIFHSTVQAYIDQKGIGEQTENARSEDDLKGILPEHFFRTSHQIDPEKRVKIQGICQRYIDHSISSTVNLPENIDPETISNVYIDAWKYGLKGITIYRDGSRYPILSVVGKRTKFQEMKEKTFKITNEEGQEVMLKGDEVFVLPDGTLTTPYHALQKGPIENTNSLYRFINR